MNPPKPIHESKPPSVSVQATLERLFSQYRIENRWDLAVLYTSDGFLMARDGSFDLISEADLLEMAFTVRSVSTPEVFSSGPMEVAVRPSSGKQFVFHFFAFQDEMLILAVVTDGKKGIRRALNRIRKTLLSLA
jgi:hypothetical protein